MVEKKINGLIGYLKESGGKSLRFVLLAIVVFAVVGVVTEQFYYRTSQLVMNVSDFTKTLHKKEKLAKEKLEYVKARVSSMGVSSLYDDKNLYEVSKENDISLLVYEGEELLFWSSDAIDVMRLDKYPFKTFFLLKTQSAYSECFQAFADNYRFIVMVKIKSCSNNSRRGAENGVFAKDFELPGNVMIAEEDDSNTYPIYNSDGDYVFSLVNTPVYDYDDFLYWLSMFSWIVVMSGLFMIIYHTARYYKDKFLRLPYFLASVLIAFLLLFLLSYFRIPEILFSGNIFVMKFYSSSLIHSFGHLILYTIFAYSCYAVADKRVHASFSLLSKPEPMRRRYVFLLQLFSSIVFFAIYSFVTNFIYNSEMDLAVTHVRDLSFYTIISLFLIISWFCLWGFLNGKFRKLYGMEEIPLFDIVVSRGYVFLFWLLITLVLGKSVDWYVLICFFAITFFIDIYKRFYTRTTFLYVSVLVVLFVSMVVFSSYLLCKLNNEDSYFEAATKLLSQAHVQDGETERMIRSRNPDIKGDRRIHYLMTDSFVYNSSELIEGIIRNRYFDKIWNWYDVKVQICNLSEDIEVRRRVEGETQMLPFSFIQDDCKLIENTNFYVNKNELYALSYIGVFYYGNRVMYIKLFPNVYSSGFVFANQIFPSDSEDRMSKVSVAKYMNGELIFASGDYRYPNTTKWMGSVKGGRSVFEQNGYVHHCLMDENENIVLVSRIEYQSIICLMMISYLFSAYLLISMMVLLVSRFKRKSEATSLLTRMQTSFVIPLLISSVVLGLVSIVFYLNVYRDRLERELGSMGNTMQQSLQKRLADKSNFSSENKEEIVQLLREVSSYYNLDVILYGDNGLLYASSRLSFYPYDGEGSMLMSPLARFSGKQEIILEEVKNKTEYISYYLPIYNLKNQNVGYINLLSSSAAMQIKNDMTNIIVVVIDLYLVIMMISIFVIWIITKNVTKPLAEMSNMFREIRLTGENKKIVYKYDDEIGDVVTQYNKMVDELRDNAEKLAKSEREYAWREMARRIAHEIKNPLTPMKLSVQMAVRKMTLDPENFNDYFKKSSNVLIEQIDNLSRIASEFSNFAKTSQGEISRIDLVEKLSSSVALFENNDENVRFTLNLHGFEHVFIMADGKQLLQVFNNLFRNAIQAIGECENGRVDISLRVENNSALISVSDNGCGIPEENRDSLFLPNFTTKTSGMGLGLAIVKNIINTSGGSIWFDSQVGKGTIFYIKMPIVD